MIIIIIIIVHFVIGCADRYVGRKYICRFPPLLSMIAMAIYGNDIQTGMRVGSV